MAHRYSFVVAFLNFAAPYFLPFSSPSFFSRSLSHLVFIAAFAISRRRSGVKLADRFFAKATAAAFFFFAIPRYYRKNLLAPV